MEPLTPQETQNEEEEDEDLGYDGGEHGNMNNLLVHFSNTNTTNTNTNYQHMESMTPQEMQNEVHVHFSNTNTNEDDEPNKITKAKSHSLEYLLGMRSTPDQLLQQNIMHGSMLTIFIYIVKFFKLIYAHFIHISNDIQNDIFSYTI